MDFLVGALVASGCITLGHILHMRALDRRLVPPPVKPAPKPQPQPQPIAPPPPADSLPPGSYLPTQVLPDTGGQP